MCYNVTKRLHKKLAAPQFIGTALLLLRRKEMIAMKLYKKVLSAVVSCMMMGVTIAESATQTFAVDIAEETVTELYDNTESDESKVISETSSTTVTNESTYTTTTTSQETAKSTTTTTTASSETTTAQTTEPPFNVFDIYNAHMGYTTTTVTTVPTELDPSLVQRQARGIDVSAWQPNIDWKAVKDSGIEFAILRAGYGKVLSQEDPTFDYNMQQAQANGIACGAYWYSYATDVESAILEAQVCYEVIKDYDFTYPVYFDIEDPSQSHLSTAQISAITEAFCSTLSAKGYRVGVYSYTTFLKTKIYSEILDKYDVWVANFDVSAPSYSGNYGMWQYTASGSVDGVPGDVDLDVSYVNYPYIKSPETYVDTPATSFDCGIKEITSTTTVPNYLYKGIDVSEWQGDIDWNAVKNSGEVDYAIIRAGYGKYVEQEDKYFDYNITTAQSLDIDCGAYWYSYAKTPEDAVAEAKAFCEVIKDYKLEYPVYFDIEDSCFDNMTMAEVDAITEAFCSYMEEQGYCCGVTSYSLFLKNKLGVSFLNKYAVWIAHYGVRKPSYGGYYGMWQYTSEGKIDGINGNVDRDYAYIDYPALMIECHRNGY